MNLRIFVTIAVAVALFASGILVALGTREMAGNFTHPNEEARAMKQWRFGNNLAGGENKAIVRCRIRDVDPGQPYTLRVTVTNQRTGEKLTLELLDMIATHDPDVDFRSE